MSHTNDSAPRITARVLGSLAVAALTVPLLSGCAAGTPGGGSPSAASSESSPAAEGSVVTQDDAYSDDVAESSIGEPVETDTFAITVLQAKATDLAETSKVLQERTKAVAVNVRMMNTSGADVPLNALPYSVFSTVLRSGGVDYPGSLVSNFANETRDGVVGEGVTLNLNFLYQYPASATEAEFAWVPAPTAEGYPTIIVPLPADALVPK